MPNKYQVGAFSGNQEPPKPSPQYPMKVADVFLFLKKQVLKREMKTYILKLWDQETCELLEAKGEVTLTPVKVDE